MNKLTVSIYITKNVAYSCVYITFSLAPECVTHPPPDAHFQISSSSYQMLLLLFLRFICLPVSRPIESHTYKLMCLCHNNIKQVVDSENVGHVIARLLRLEHRIWRRLHNHSGKFHFNLLYLDLVLC